MVTLSCACMWCMWKVVHAPASSHAFAAIRVTWRNTATALLIARRRCMQHENPTPIPAFSSPDLDADEHCRPSNCCQLFSSVRATSCRCTASSPTRHCMSQLPPRRPTCFNISNRLAAAEAQGRAPSLVALTPPIRYLRATACPSFRPGHHWHLDAGHCRALRTAATDTTTPYLFTAPVPPAWPSFRTSDLRRRALPGPGDRRDGHSDARPFHRSPPHGSMRHFVTDRQTDTHGTIARPPPSQTL